MPEKDPNGIEAHAPGAKLDGGKVDAALLLDFSRALNAVAEVCTFGANKYSRGGWQHVNQGEQRYTSAMVRHLLKEGMGQIVDSDSGLQHAAHTAWNALARLELALRAQEKAPNSI